MPERGGQPPSEAPEPDDVTRAIPLDLTKKPRLFEEEFPETRLFREEAPTLEARYAANACLEEIYNIMLRHTPPGAPTLLSCGDVRWLHRKFKQTAQEAWDLPEPFPDFTLTHLLGAAKRQIAHLSELKRFHESDVFDPALHTYDAIASVIGRAIADDNPTPLSPGDSAE